MLGTTTLTPAAAFGLALRARRRASNWSQEHLGLEAGVQRNFISLIETGQNQPSVTTLFKLAAALRCTPSKLIAETEELMASVHLTDAQNQ